MPVAQFIFKGAKLAAKGTGFVSLLTAVNMAQVGVYQHFGRWSPKELERGMRKDQHYKYMRGKAFDELEC